MASRAQVVFTLKLARVFAATDCVCFRYMGEGARVAPLLNLHGNAAEIEAQVNGISDRFTLDTGK